MHKMLSIIIPVYNAAPFLDDCLQSCLDQGFHYEEIEIICVNDGSKDNSLEILNRWKQKHQNIVIIDKANAGVSSARNSAMKVAQGKYITFCDADDFFQSNCLKLLVDEMQDESIDCLFFNHEIVNENAKYKNEGQQSICISYTEKVPDSLYTVWGAIYDRKILKVNDVWFDEDLRYGEDTVFSHHAAMFFSMRNRRAISNQIYKYRMVSSSLTHTSTNGNKALFQECIKKRIQIYGDLYAKTVCNNEVSDHLKHNTKVRQSITIQHYLMNTALDLTVDFKAVLMEMKRNGYYPYPFIWDNLKPVGGKQTIVNWVCFLFPVKCYYYLFCKLCRLVKRKWKKNYR